MKLSIRHDLLIAGALSFAGVLTRVPYLALVPVFSDEVMQTVYALSIRPGEFMPLVGNDPYVGPLFPYLVAVSMRVLGSTPITSRIIVMVMGALTVGLTYLLARVLGLRRPWATLVGLLMAANPHHILINSHYAGATYTLPLFTTAFLLALVWAVKRESGPWLVMAGALLGFALQANPVPLLMLPGVAVWFLAQPAGGLERKSSIGLRTRWPYLAAVACALVYSPLIIHNVQLGLANVKETGSHRAYIWQSNPSLWAFGQNLGRLVLQLCRQVSGVLEGDETLRSLMGPPLLLSAWAVAGLMDAARRKMSLPILAVGSQVFIMPWLSNFYGMTGPARFTTQLTPLIFTAMGALAAGAWDAARSRFRTPGISKATVWLAGALLVAFCLWPLTLLYRYYEHALASGDTNAYYFALYDEFSRRWHGEKIFINTEGSWYNVTEYFLAVHGVPYNLMSPDRILEQLVTGQETGSVVLILYDNDVPRFRSQTELIRWDSPVTQPADKPSYGIYAVADAHEVRKPTFVFANIALAPGVRPAQANFADQLGLIGYEVRPDKPVPGGDFIVNIHWKTIGVMSEAYTGFVHLIGPDGRLVAQDDHELGRGYYRTIFWQPGEIIREKYVLTVPEGAAGGEYLLQAGVYGFPSLKRLVVRSADVPTQDDTVTLCSIRMEP